MNESRKISEILSLILQKILSALNWLNAECSLLISIARSACIKYKQIVLKTLVPLFIIMIGYVSCTMSQRQISRNVQDIFAISDEIRAFYTNKPDYWGLNTEFAIKNKIVPNEFVKDNKILLSNGLEILIGNGADGDTIMPLSQSFDIVLPQLNKAQCISYAEMPLKQDNLLKLLSIRIINASGDYLFEWGGQKKLPVQKYTTKNLCADNKNTIIWSVK